MSGAWVFVCGPSGSGKDSVIESARQMVGDNQGIVFARRMVTRAVQSGSDHDPVTEPAFMALLEKGELAWHWQAHGYHYAIAHRYSADVKAGRLVVVNGSRAHVQALPAAPDRRVVKISCDTDRLACRLVQRSRDSSTAVAERMARNYLLKELQADYEIVNNAELAVAGQCLADYLSA